MDLEQRVQILEQELQILKGQIQATLLEIQEHVLTNAYPALRAEVPLQSDLSMSTEPGRSSAHSVKATYDDEEDVPALPKIVKRISVDDADSQPRNGKAKAAAIVEEDDDDDEQAMPIVRKVTLNDQPTQSHRPRQLRQTEETEDEEQPEPVVRKVKLDHQPVPSRQPRQSRQPAEIIEDTESEHEYEDEPVVRPVSTNRNRNGYKAAVKENSPVAYVEPQMPAPAEPDAGSDWTSLNRLAEWVGDKVKKLGVDHTRELIERNAQKGHFGAELKDALLQLVLLYDGDGSLNTQRLDQVLENLSQAPESPEAEPTTEQLENQKLILRLIAGVQNVGANTAWRRNK